MTSSSDFAVRDTRQPGHFWADNEVLDVYGPRLGVYGFAVYMVLARHAQNGSGEARISVRKVAKFMAISHSSVLHALATLIECGLVLLRSEGDRSMPAIYALADVKVLLDPEYKQLRLAEPREVVTTRPPVVSTRPQVVAQGNGVVSTRPRNKERKTFTRLNQKQEPSPTPPASQEGLELPRRDIRALAKRIDQFYKQHVMGQDGLYKPAFYRMSDEQIAEAALMSACADLLIPVTSARAVIDSIIPKKAEEQHHATA